ncbi:MULTISPECIES: ribonuclease D [unclassified Oleiphilus]|uniref:ribonuclease D n=1 Tax=unclassified Oleiphilus TaxID=2631174 RepID=UPI0009ED8A4A|nr:MULTISPECIES: ribonuclease D [unclassified Oleiphilus]
MAVRLATHFLEGSRLAMVDETQLRALEEIDFTWVDSDTKLNECVESWLQEPYIILDTEFERSTTFYAKPGLIQIAASGLTYLIDPLSLTSLKPLAAVLESDEVVIVLHSMSEDIDLLSYACDCHISNVFDTQIANAFLGNGSSVGYQRLVEAELDIALDKGETRSDWLKRPLSSKQLQYAAADVYYLETIYKNLLERLIKSPWQSAVEEDCARQVESIESAVADPQNAYLKLRGAWDLPLTKQALLQKLVCWRDEMAVGKNLPKSWVFGDASLIEMARTRPTAQNSLFSLPKVKPKSVKRFGLDAIALISNEQEVVPEGFTPIAKPIKGKELEFYKKIKSLVAKQAATANIDPALIAGRKQMEAWVIHYWRDQNPDLPDLINGWRSDLIGQPLTELAATVL